MSPLDFLWHCPSQKRERCLFTTGLGAGPTFPCSLLREGVMQGWNLWPFTQPSLKPPGQKFEGEQECSLNSPLGLWGVSGGSCTLPWCLPEARWLASNCFLPFEAALFLVLWLERVSLHGPFYLYLLVFLHCWLLSHCWTQSEKYGRKKTKPNQTKQNKTKPRNSLPGHLVSPLFPLLFRIYLSLFCIECPCISSIFNRRNRKRVSTPSSNIYFLE